MSQFDSIQAVYDHAISNGGGTYAIETHHNKRFITEPRFTTGYYVATGGNEWVIEGENFYPETVIGYIAKFLPLLTNSEQGDYFLGIWESNGYWYLDISEFVLNYSEAIRLGEERNQIAVWDISEENEISVSLALL